MHSTSAVCIISLTTSVCDLPLSCLALPKMHMHDEEKSILRFSIHTAHYPHIQACVLVSYLTHVLRIVLDQHSEPSGGYYGSVRVREILLQGIKHFSSSVSHKEPFLKCESVVYLFSAPVRMLVFFTC